MSRAYQIRVSETVVKTGRSSVSPEAVWAVLSDYFQLHTWPRPSTTAAR